MRTCFLLLSLCVGLVACSDETSGSNTTPDSSLDGTEDEGVERDASLDASDMSDAPDVSGDVRRDQKEDSRGDSKQDLASDVPPDERADPLPLELVNGVFGGLRMHTQVPPALTAGRPLVVALHGCLQDAQTYAQVGWGELAQAHDFAVVYPEQPLGNRCFSWFNALDVRRDLGQARQISRMIERMVEDHSIDPNRVYITGLSAGGAMTAAMAAVYPELFKAAAPIAGVPFGCAETLLSSGVCLAGTREWTSAQWAQKVFEQSGEQTTYPRISIWHGVDDDVVAPANAEHMATQWLAVHGVAQAPSSTMLLPSGVTLTQHASPQGEVVVERRMIERLGHGTPIDPEAGCGQPSSYVLARGICSTRDIGVFFELVP